MRDQEPLSRRVPTSYPKWLREEIAALERKQQRLEADRLRSTFWTEEEARQAVTKRLRLILNYLEDDHNAWALGERAYEEDDQRIYIAVEIRKAVE